jgi:hypothetical protein
MTSLCTGAIQEAGVADEAAQQVAMEASCAIAMTDAQGGQVTAEGARVVLAQERFSAAVASAAPVSAAYRDILTLAVADYTIALSLSSGETLTFSKLGYGYEDFARKLVALRNEQILADMLGGESLLDGGARGQFTMWRDGAPAASGACEARVYETGLVVLPDDADVMRFPLSDLDKAWTADYALNVTLRDGVQLMVSKLGPRLDPLERSLMQAAEALSLKVQELLAEAAPGIDSLTLRRAADIMREGRAARRCDIEAISPALWAGLETRLANAGAAETYGYLKGVGDASRVAVGLKRGLMGDRTGEYVWFLVPVYSADSKTPGNAVVMEAYSLGEDLKAYATYVFRLAPRADYARGMSDSELAAAADAAIETVNRCMIEVNFRREPIYLADEKLLDPRYLRYWFAVRRLPGLRWLREHFVGRAIHSTPEEWQAGVDALLAFNVSTADDSARPAQGQPAESEEGDE